MKPNSQQSPESRLATGAEKAQDPPPDLLVIQPIKDWSCAECRGTGDLLIMDEPGPLCLACSDLDHLVFLPAGDVELAAIMASEIGRLFPRCPTGGAEAIARHTSLRGSGRVGHSAAGRSLDDEAITLAEVASVRHQNTEYDSLLMSGVSRQEARDRIRAAVDRILAAWAQPA